MDCINLLELIPQRIPFLLVDCINELSDEKICTERKVTIGDYLPVSASYMIEHMAQSASALMGYRNRKRKCNHMYLAGIEEAQFQRLPAPGDTVATKVSVELAVGNLAKVQCESRILQSAGTGEKNNEYGAGEPDGVAVLILYMS